MSPGDLVKIWGSYSTIEESDLVRGWATDPGVHGHHTAIWMTNGLPAVVLEVIDERCRVLVCDRAVWLYSYQLKILG